MAKVLIVEAERGGDGPKPLDLDSGVVELVMPPKQDDTDEQG